MPTVTQKTSIDVRIKPRENFGGTAVGATGVRYFAGLLDVDVSNKANNYVVVYNSVSQKFETQPITVINGGSF